MNKTITITLNGIIFHIEEEAFLKLKEYLESVRNRLGADADKDEVMTDIEASVAEKFTAKVSAAKQVITLADITELIKVMGTVEDFDEELRAGEKSGGEKEAAGEKIKEEKKLKKLFRDPDDVIIAGICSGIAVYFGVDPLLIRLIFFASIFFGGTGVILYLILWFIVPKAQTSAQKIEMRGEPVTLAAIEQAVKENVEKIKSAENTERVKSGLRKLLELPFALVRLVFTVLGKIMNAIIPVIRIIIGLGFVFFPLFLTVGLAFAAFIFAFRLNHPYFVSDIPLTDFAYENAFRLGILAAYLIALIPLLFLIFLGISLLRKKSVFSVLMVSGLLGAWMVAIVAAGIIGFDYAPRIQEKINETRVRETAVKNLDLKDFNAISALGNYQIEIIKSDNFSVKAEGFQKEIERMKTEVQDGILKIDQQPRRKGICFFCLDSETVKLTVSMPELSGFKGSGVARLNTSGFNGETLNIDLADAARAEMDANYTNISFSAKDVSSLSLKGVSTILEITLKDAARLKYSGAVADQVKIQLSDIARTELSGQAPKLTAALKDSSRLDAFFFLAEEAEINQSDVSRADINASRLIKAELRDVSRLNYAGDAEVRSNVMGVTAKINKANNPLGSEDSEDYEKEEESDADSSADGF
jgi:phage shock protein PspC (stress-responsive transcriptional regulator)